MIELKWRLDRSFDGGNVVGIAWYASLSLFSNGTNKVYWTYG